LPTAALAGFVLLLALCLWQVDRGLGRQARNLVAAERMHQDPADLPRAYRPAMHELLPVRVSGRFDHEAERHVLSSLPPFGPGFRVITPLDMDNGRRVLVDRGFVPERLRAPESRPEGQMAGTVAVEGILVQPRERGPFVPDPDPATGIWFARDTEALAVETDSEALMIVARESADGGFPRADPPPPELRNIHVGYAWTWGLLAAGWAVISGLLWRRERRRASGVG